MEEKITQEKQLTRLQKQKKSKRDKDTHKIPN